jgi:F-type H+-transporting ATPase subunit alpha
MNKEDTINQILDSIKDEISAFEPEVSSLSSGKVVKVSDGVAKIVGLKSVKAFEVLDISGTKALAVNLEEFEIGAIILGDEQKVIEGSLVSGTGKVLQIPVGENVLGRVVDSLGRPLDGKGGIETKTFYPVEKVAPGVITREPVSVPLSTGIKMIDALIPIGRGQRELIIGDRGTGKTAIAIDTIVNQKDQDVICIFVAIGQKDSKIARIVKDLEDRGAMSYTTVVLASASSPASMQFLAPFSGIALAEYFMDKQKDVLIIYDDLSKHAASYREISLLLKRPPGREAYPGDVFYLHSRLLERSCRRNIENGGGSITALPIIETQAGDISAYIPTNVISITDGQIFLETDLFYQGFRPAINAGLSVSRVGSSAQTKAMKKSAGKLKLYLAQYRELSAFAQFGSDLDSETKKELDRGKRIVELLKQPQYAPVDSAIQVALFYSASKGLLDDIEASKMKEFEEGFSKYLKSNHRGMLDIIKKDKDLKEDTENKLKKSISDFKDIFNSK